MPDTTPRFAAILSDFNAALDVLKSVLSHINKTKPAPELRVVMLNSSIVALTSTIEETIRNLFSEYLSIAEEFILDHRNLRVGLQKANLECAIRELQTLKNEKNFLAASNVALNLSKCLGGLPGYHLLKKQLTYNFGNFRSKQVIDTSKNVGITEIWNLICDSTEVETYTGDTLIETRVNSLIIKWNSIFDERDLVVHQVSQATGWGEDLIGQVIELAKLVVARLGKCLADDANTFALP